MNQDKNHSFDMMQAPQGTVLSVDHVPLFKGEKIDTHIVLKGHPLPVLWRNSSLHHTTAPELTWKPDNCLYCQQCGEVCPKGCLHITDDGLQIDHEKCDACGDCVKECPSMSLQMLGNRTTAGDLLHKTLKQNYSTAEKIGQITITGGEPGLQSAFCADLLFQIEAAGIPAVLDTSGLAPYGHLLPLLSRPAQIRYELISINNQLHTHLTGYGNSLILENLEKVSQEIHSPTELIIRTPLIPDKTAIETEIYQTGKWLAEHVMPNCHGWELFEPKIICDEIFTFSDKDWAQILGWAKDSGFPTEIIYCIDSSGLQH
jgi:pyruvate formate lyase activating enzyme